MWKTVAKVGKWLTNCSEFIDSLKKLVSSNKPPKNTIFGIKYI